MIEFVDNNALSSVIFFIFFFLNKDFYSRMNFELDTILYESTRKRLQVTKVENIAEHMNKTLKFARESLVKTRKQMIKQTNKHKKEVNHEAGTKLFLSGKNIVTIRSFKKLNDKMLEFFINLNLVGSSYKLKLLNFMRVHDVFYSDLLRSVVNDSLSD